MTFYMKLSSKATLVEGDFRWFPEFKAGLIDTLTKMVKSAR